MVIKCTLGDWVYLTLTSSPLYCFKQCRRRQVLDNQNDVISKSSLCFCEKKKRFLVMSKWFPSGQMLTWSLHVHVSFSYPVGPKQIRWQAGPY